MKPWSQACLAAAHAGGRLRGVITLTAALLGSALLGSCGTAPPPAAAVARGDHAAVRAQLQAYVDAEVASAGIAGLSIALIDGSELLAAWGSGWADVAAKRPADAHTLYRMGSISKLFTDTAAMQLVAEGRLGLDAPVQQALPWFRLGGAPGAAPITLRQLMSHHAGLPRDTAGGMWLTRAPGPDGDFRAMLRSLATVPPDAPPGLAFAYSNVGLDVVGAMVEAASGEPFEARLRRTLLAPLGMDDAQFSVEVPAHPAMASAHRRREPQTEPALRDLPAGGLVASVSDLARFVAMQFAEGRNARGEVVLPQAAWAEMLRVQNEGLPLDADLRVGLGWMFSTFGNDTVKDGGPVAHHAGATFHFRSQLMMLPAQRLGVVVASNDGAAGPVVNRVAQRALALLLEARTGLRQRPAVPGFQPSATPWSASQRQQAQHDCLGEHVTVAGPVTVAADGDRMVALVGAEGQRLELLEGERGRLGLRYRALGILPVALGPLGSLGLECRRVAGRALLLGVLDDQRMVVGERLPPAEPLPANAAAWTGSYRPRLHPGEVAGMGATVRVLVHQGRLWADYQTAAAFGGQKVRTMLKPLSDTEARLIGPLADTGPVARLEPRAGQAPRVHFSGWVFEREGP